MMRAVVMRAFGEPDVLRVEKVPRPSPRSGEALVQVAAVGVSRTRDIATRTGDHPFSKKIAFPHVLGGDFTGVVEDVGAGVDRVLVGARVAVRSTRNCRECPACRAGRQHQCTDLQMLGIELWGSYAEFVCAPADNLYPLPDEIDMVEAAALAATGPVALAQLHAAVVDQDSTVLITGITGALATTVAALASTFDARVIGLTRRPQAVHPGLDVTALDTARDDLAQALIETTNGKGVTIVIDNVADPATFGRYFPALARGARVVISGAIGSAQLPVLRVPADALYLRSIALLGVRTASTRVVQDFWNLVGQHSFRLPDGLVHEATLESAAHVHADMTAGRTAGHVVLRVSEVGR